MNTGRIAFAAVPLLLAACAQEPAATSQGHGTMAQADSTAPGGAPMSAGMDDTHDPAKYVEQGRMVDHVAFTQAAFEAAQAEGKPILIDVYAPWCPVCAKQQEGIAAAMADPANRDVTVFRLDFDHQKGAQRQFRVTSQASLIAFNGAQETGRLLGETDPDALGDLIASTRA